MRLESEVVEKIKSYLSMIMDKDEAQKYADFDLVLEMVRGKDICWQVAVSAGVFAVILYGHKESQDAKLALTELVDHAIEPYEDLLQVLLTTPKAEDDDTSQARLLFHTRFGLGLLLLSHSRRQFDQVSSSVDFYLNAVLCKERAVALLHDMVTTPLSIKGYELVGYESRTGPGIVSYTTDMARAKVATVLLSLPFLTTGDTKNYGEVILYITEALPYTDSELAAFFVQTAGYLIDQWFLGCQEIDKSKKYPPTAQWLDLFASASALISLSQTDESDSDLPQLCKEDTAQYLAWKFGLLVGRYLVSSDLSMADVRDGTLGFVLDNTEWYDKPGFSRTTERLSGTLYTICALICEYGDDSNWESLKDFSYAMWHNSYRGTGECVCEITPESDLYWAIRSGFAQAMIDAKKTAPEVVPMPGRINLVEMGRLIKAAIEDSLRPVIRQYPDRGKISASIRQRMGDVYDRLPGEVIDPLIDGECNFEADRDYRQAVLAFHLSVEKCLRAYLLFHLDGYVRRLGTAIPVKDLPSSLSAGEWGRVFEAFGEPDANMKPKFRPYPRLLKNYIQQSGIEINLQTLKSLGMKLRNIQDYRNDAKLAKYVKPRAEERKDLACLRNLVIGNENEPSTIALIFDLFGPQNE